MSDLICRKTMQRCNTPGMCMPHGGCRVSVLADCRVSYSNSTDSVTPMIIDKVKERLALIARMRVGGESLDPVFSERDVRSLVGVIDQLKADNYSLRKALGEISGQVDGNIRCAVRDAVNCRGDVQDIYDYCNTIDAIIDAAMTKGK